MYHEVGHAFIYISSRDLLQCSAERNVVSDVNICVNEDLT